YSNASRAERRFGLCSDIPNTAARYRTASQLEGATTRSDGPLACRAERKLGLFADILADAAVPALRRPGGPRYWMAFRSKPRLGLFAGIAATAARYRAVSQVEHATNRR